MDTSNILRLKDLLKEKNVTGKELADKIGVAEMTISNIVKGKTFPKPETLLNIANVLQVDVKDLFNSTKSTAKPLYIKDDNGNFIEVGAFDIDKLTTDNKAMNNEQTDNEQ